MEAGRQAYREAMNQPPAASGRRSAALVAAGAVADKRTPPMSEDIFRIVITAAVALACLAFVVQAGVAIGLYRVARNMQEKIGPLAEKGAVMAEKAGPVIDRLGR